MAPEQDAVLVAPNALRSARQVWRRTAIVVLLYLLPLLAAVVYFAFRPIGSLSDPTPKTVFLGELALATGLAVCAGCWGRLKELRRRRPDMPAERQAAILRDFPEFGRLRMAIGASKLEMHVNGRTLVVGQELLLAAGDDSRAAAGALFFGLAHEARHLEVGANGLVNVLRFLKRIYLPFSLLVYSQFLMNWMSILDDADRLALIAYLWFIPFAWGLLSAILDESVAAAEWQLEMDADDAGQQRCCAAGKTVPRTQLIKRANAIRLAADGHPPALLRLRSLAAPGRTIALTRRALAGGWLIAALTVGMSVLFDAVTVSNSDQFNGYLGLLNTLLFLLVAGFLVMAAGWGNDPDTSFPPCGWSASLATAASALVMRVHASASRFILWFVLFLGVPAIAGLVLDIVSGRINPGLGLPSLALFGGCILSAAGRALFPFAPRWMILGAFGDSIRLAAVTWFMMATGSLPYYDDGSKLGGAIMQEPQLIQSSFQDLWTDEPLKLAYAVVSSALFAALSVACALWGRYVSARAGLMPDISTESMYTL